MPNGITEKVTAGRIACAQSVRLQAHIAAPSGPIPIAGSAQFTENRMTSTMPSQ